MAIVLLKGNLLGKEPRTEPSGSGSTNIVSTNIIIIISRSRHHTSNGSSSSSSSRSRSFACGLSSGRTSSKSKAGTDGRCELLIYLCLFVTSQLLTGKPQERKLTLFGAFFTDQSTTAIAASAPSDQRNRGVQQRPTRNPQVISFYCLIPPSQFTPARHFPLLCVFVTSRKIFRGLQLSRSFTARTLVEKSAHNFCSTRFYIRCVITLWRC